MINFLLGPFLIWSSQVVSWLVFVLAAVSYFFGKRPLFQKKFSFLSFRNLIVAALSFRLLYIFLEMAGQYYLWSQNSFTKLFLASPLDRQVSLPLFLSVFPSLFSSRLGYFLFYSYGRFWLNFLIVLVSTSVFYIFLKILKKYRERFFEEGELTLGFLLAFLAGWPSFIVFVPLTFVLIVLISVFRHLFLKELYTTIGLPMLLAGLIILAIGDKLVIFLNLSVFRI